MKKWLQKLNTKMQGWMVGRNGYDELSRFLSIAAVVCIVLSMFISLFYPIALALLIWSLFRTYSRNTAKRQRERMAYLKLSGNVKSWFRIRKDMWADRKTHRYYRCPNCKTYTRVPKGKGKIKISCPKCHEQFIRKT